MKIAVIVVLAILAIFVNVKFIQACKAGSEDMGNGVCADLPQPKDPVVETPVQPSDEKPPRSGQEPWERGEITADNPPSTSAQDAKEDQEKAEATAEGKAKAGVPANWNPPR